jgi:hypothetical protein
MTDDGFEIRKPDGTPASIEDIAQAMHNASSATEDTMSCPVTDCSGKIEAQASFWMEIHPDGTPYLAGIGWTEGGVIECSHGGREHVSQELRRRLEPTFAQFCIVAENKLGAEKGEDRLPKASQRQEETKPPQWQVKAVRFDNDGKEVVWTADDDAHAFGVYAGQPGAWQWVKDFPTKAEAEDFTKHDARPDDNPEPGDRCKDCGQPITWVGPNHTDWEHI